jgi:hypothetical protein
MSYIMQIKITDNKSIKEIQTEFQNAFPFLKIEFFKNDTEKRNSSIKSQPIPDRTTIAMVRHIHTESEVNISGNRSVEELENDFKKYGLFVEVFRKSGNMWIETTLTHHWSLLRQNYEGQQLS